MQRLRFFLYSASSVVTRSSWYLDRLTGEAPPKPASRDLLLMVLEEHKAYRCKTHEMLELIHDVNLKLSLRITIFMN